jgi:two-component system CheB/CheR fusion protein
VTLTGPAWVVALGASAGGVEALEGFFRHAPVQSRIAYVVITHLAADVESHLAEVLSKCTSMPVSAVVADQPLLADRVYVLSPGLTLAASEGWLTVRAGDRRVPATDIDDFFAGLGRAFGHRAIGIVLSGSGADGAAGLRALHEAGGVCLAQSPASATCPSMPTHAIAAGVVREVRDPAGLAAWVHTLADRMLLPPAQSGALDGPTVTKVLDLLRAGTGRDFSGYKLSTIMRRLRRRMTLAGREAVESYVALLESDAVELNRLRDDLLINVTHFFRDPGVFRVLKADIRHAC